MSSAHVERLRDDLRLKIRGTARVITGAFVISLFWLLAAPPAHAYIDPGSSSYVLQVVIGAAAGVGLALATFRRRIAASVRRLFRREATKSRHQPNSESASSADEGDSASDR